MVIPGKNHPWKISSLETENTYKYPREKGGNELEDTAQLISRAQKVEGINGIEDIKDSYTTLLAISEIAKKYGRSFEEVEQEIEQLEKQGYSKRAQGRFIKLTLKGENLIKHLAGYP